MKRLILTNWAVKIVCLLLAIILWFLIRKNVENGPRPDGSPEAKWKTLEKQNRSGS